MYEEFVLLYFIHFISLWLFYSNVGLPGLQQLYKQNQ